MGHKRQEMRYERVERNIRQVFYVYDDGTVAPAGYEVRVGGKRLGTHRNITTARKVRDKAQHDHGQGSLVTPTAGKATVKVVADRWLTGTRSTKWKPRTAAGYRGIVTHRLAPLHDVPVNKVTPDVVDSFIAGLIKEGKRPSTVRHVWFVLNQVMRLAVRDRHIAANPCAEVEVPGVDRTEIQVPELADVEALLSALASLDHPKAGEWALYAELAAYAGLRSGEICGLRVGRLDPLRHTLRVEETVYVISGKTSSGQPKSKAGKRTVTVSGDLSDRLATHVTGRTADDYVFGDGTAPFRHDNYYRRVFRPTARALGLTSLRFHDLRHFYASLLLTNPNLNAVDISKALGHADANLLHRTYGHSFEQALDGVGDWITDQRQAAKSSTAANVRKIG